MKTFRYKLLPVLFEELHHRCFLMYFAKLRRIFLYSSFKEIASERKTEWEKVIQVLKEHIVLH